MAIINDTDLLLIEPSLFTDASVAAITVDENDDATITDTSLSSAGSDFYESSVTAGQVIVVNGEPLEIVSMQSKSQLEVSGRRLPEGVPVPPGDGTGLSFVVRTFMRHVEDAELWLARALGLDAADPATPLTSADVINYDELADLVSYRVIATAFAQSAAAAPSDASLRDRAELYDRMASEVKQLVTALIDLDGDGVADERRRLAVGTWVRV